MPNEWFQPIAKDYPGLEKEYLRLELNKTPINKKRTHALSEVRSLWLGAVRELRTVILSGWKSYALEAAVDIIKNGIAAHEAGPKT